MYECVYVAQFMLEKETNSAFGLFLQLALANPICISCIHRVVLYLCVCVSVYVNSTKPKSNWIVRFANLKVQK